ncbi:MAG: 2-hydroxychromene-2-carboxylate isomerase [Rhodocyclaceae bacterium]|nr:2-hydroxychromene-2-carboxylate isomerase [Rhodocyclaceae bacterium]
MGGAGGARLEFWLEFASTYSYLSVMRVEALAAEAGVEVAWRPFLLGPVFMSLGWNDSPFNIYPPKGRYMWRDMERLCARYGLPLTRPSAFPRNGLLAARIACRGQSEPWIGDFCRAVMAANFADNQDIGERQVVAALLDAMALPAEALIADAESDAGKAALRKQTDAAIERGIFGAPSFVVGEELFWGNDRLEDALAWATDRAAQRDRQQPR